MSNYVSAHILKRPGAKVSSTAQSTASMISVFLGQKGRMTVVTIQFPCSYTLLTRGLHARKLRDPVHYLLQNK